MKQTVSIFVAAGALMLLGFTSWTGGISNSNNQVLATDAVKNFADDHYINAKSAFAGGYGTYFL